MNPESPHRTQDDRMSMAEYLIQAFSGNPQATAQRLEREEAAKQGRLREKRAA